MATKTITSSALQRRINRALVHHGQVLHKCREGSRYHHERGDYYLVNVETRGIDETHVDLKNLEHELNRLNNSESTTERETQSKAPKLPVSDKEFTARTRQMQKELRVMQRRINELIKKDRHGGLSKEEQAELPKLLRDTTQKATDNVFEIARLGRLL
jgi:hypothetical protein